jgi:hypothetical protein
MHPDATLPIPAQVAGLRSFFPLGQTTWAPNWVKWKGRLTPSECGRGYAVELHYQLSDAPAVWVRKPNLKELAGERRLPHVYDQKTQELCLYLPRRGFWKPSRSLAVTILPWTCLWLFYFELWLITDDWAGAGEHPAIPPAAPRNEPRATNTILF